MVDLSQLTAEEKIGLAGQTTQATLVNAGKHNVSFIDTGDDEYPISSGILIDVFGHLLIATAAHCVPNNPSGRLWFLPFQQGRRLGEDYLELVRHQRHPNYHSFTLANDLAFLEIDRRAAESYFGELHTCPITRVVPTGTGVPRSVVSVIGTPRDRVDPTQRYRGNPSMAAYIDAYSTVVLTPDEWPPLPEGAREADVDHDLFMEYPETVRNLSEGTNMESHSPVGFSGGGIWDQRVKVEGLWSPDNSVLIGIQSCWYSTSTPRVLRATQILKWLQLVYNHYPDLQPQLDQQYPAISSNSNQGAAH